MNQLEVQNYGFNLILKEYAGFPRMLPLPCHLEHGWTPLEEALVSDLNTDKPLMLVFSKRRLAAWKRKSSLPVAIMGSPFVHYKNTRKLTKHKDAYGTVVFPSHSTYDLKVKFDIQRFCKQLQALPEEFQPVTICLFWLDYIDKQADIYRKAGFSVVTAGPKFTNSLSFPKNFYKILLKHKYSASNDVGSYSFYAVDCGMPFFLVGEPSVVVNKGLKDVNIGAEGRIEDTEFGLKVHRLFLTGPVKEISPAQQRLVEEEMGVRDCLSEEEMRDLFWKYFKENHMLARNFLPYIIDSSIKTAILNGPLGKVVIAIRKNIS